MTTTMSPATPGSPIGAENAPMVSLGRPGRLKRVLLTVLAIGLVVAVLGEVSKQNRGARGPSSSSYATSPGGLAALVSLLRAQNISTEQITTSVDKAMSNGRIRNSDIMVVIDQDLTRAEMEALAQHLTLGGRLVVGGRDSGAWVSRVYDRYLELTDGSRPDTRTTLRLAPGATGEVSATDSAERSLTLATRGTPTVWSGVPEQQQTFALDADFNPVAFRLGGLTALADTSVLTNEALADSDNAAFALGLLGSGDDPLLSSRVVFAEAGHGFRSGAGSGIAAIPGPIRVFLLGLILSALTWMLAVGRRIGAPDLADRPLAPGRFEHVAALGSLLARAQRRELSNASPSQPSKDV